VLDSGCRFKAECRTYHQAEDVTVEVVDEGGENHEDGVGLHLGAGQAAPKSLIMHSMQRSVEALKLLNSNIYFSPENVTLESDSGRSECHQAGRSVRPRGPFAARRGGIPAQGRRPRRVAGQVALLGDSISVSAHSLSGMEGVRPSRKSCIVAMMQKRSQWRLVMSATSLACEL